MAHVYFWSGATGGGTGADWANAFTSLFSTSTKAAGDTFWVAHDHAQTQGSALTITSPGTDAIPCRIYCVNRSGSVPPVAADLRTTATVTTTGAFGITMTGSLADCYGINFSSGSGSSAVFLNANNTTGRFMRFTNCSFSNPTTLTGSRIAIGGLTASMTILENCTFSFGVAGMMMVTAGRVIWRNTPSAVTGATIPTTLHAGTNPTELFVEGVDLGNITTQLVTIASVANSRYTFKDCKLNASVLATASGAGGFGQPEVTVIRCDSGTGYYRNEKSNSSGKMTTSAAVYTTGGASDGGTPISWQVVTTANNKFEMAFTSLPISIWNDTIGSAITVTIEAGIAAAATSTPNSDIWIEVEYLGTSGSTLASKATSGLLTAVHTGSNYSTGSATWNGGVVNSKFKMAATFTPQVAGPMTIYVKAGTASATYYVDPKPVIT